MSSGLLAELQSRRNGVAAAEGDALAPARDALADALAALLYNVASRDAPEDERRTLDSTLAPDAAALKGALLKSLRVAALHRAFLGLPALMEATRRLLCAAPAKGVATYLEEALCADLAACAEPRAVASVAEVLSFMAGNGRLKKELGGFDLAAPHKKSVRTALNRATRRLAEVESAMRQASGPLPPPPKHEMERDVRLDDAEDAAAREASCVAAVDSLFVQAKVKVTSRSGRSLKSSSLGTD